MNMKKNKNLNKYSNTTQALATWYPRIQSILVKDFQRKSLTEENNLEETPGFL
jgi:hypothetical protein